MAKIMDLARIEDTTVHEMLEKALFDGPVPGICTNPGCSYTTDTDPDARAAHCEICNTQTVKSCLVLAGIQ